MSVKYALIISVLIVFCFPGVSQVYKYKSTNYDIEKPNVEGYITKYEITYHTIDLNNKVVTFEGKNSQGINVVIKYQYKSSYKESGLAAETWVLVINQKGVKEFWFSVQANNLGYDMTDGTRIAYYDVTQIK